ncbi:hypothetical protein [Prosthecobacter sp.]|uniref:hypothetical protein n=1 Tax=Prosthecobacter sp. TaxID=1965333 RepID=UPI001D4A837A|nr:hypothetical protein [Prosthecobacter sp.]MCB1276465.1 hypothetical protein [Prosthecobacter sp.]
MRRPWIKIETCTPDKPEICSIATQLRMDPDTVVGKLVRLWSWAELNRITPSDLGVTHEFLDKLVGRKGFAKALEQAGWLVETDGKLSFRNFQRHNHPVAHSRALTAKRVARHRLRKLKAAAAMEAASVEAPTAEEPQPMEEIQPEAIAASPLETPVEEPVPSEPPQVEEPEASTDASPENSPESAPVTEARPPEEEAPEPKKRRSKSSGEDPDQPMLF